jgi:putative heme-binding domain-containing protein
MTLLGFPADLCLSPSARMPVGQQPRARQARGQYTLVRLSLVLFSLLRFLWAMAVSWVCAGLAEAVPTAEWEVPEGFTVKVVASDDLVHDAFCMTLDRAGRPVVSGPGYTRTLLDDDGDGSFDRSVDWAKLPKEGAQGLWAEGNQLYWIGDDGLWRSEDRNDDLQADGPPQRLLALPTGGEHDAHALRRGPDGWWYLMVGNYAAEIQQLQRTQDPLVVSPRAGTLWRISPGFDQRIPWAHGFRNAYDFDFLANGRIVTYDSDEEREVSLPWYRPTRVMVVSPGNDAGWIDAAWFDLDDRLTMPQVISKLGRGSPTGVAVYRHRTFPEKYHDAAFVLDWTFGRVIAVYPQPATVGESTSRFMAETFMQASGFVGFAPTDLCVEPQGSLLVCVGGRGTTGALYRVETSPGPEVLEDVGWPGGGDVEHLPTVREKLLRLLAWPQPWESWATSRWVPLAKALPVGVLESAIIEDQWYAGVSDPVRVSDYRRRAAQYLAYLQLPVAAGTLEKALQSPCAATQAAGWWLLGYGNLQHLRDGGRSLASLQKPGLASLSPISAWDQLLGGVVEQQRYQTLGLKRWPVVEYASLDEQGKEENDWRVRRSLRGQFLWAQSRSRPIASSSLDRGQMPAASVDDRLARRLYGRSEDRLEAELLDALALRVSAKQVGEGSDQLLEALTTLQASLGDYRYRVPSQKAPPQVHALDGYRATASLKLPEAIREGWTRWCLSLLDHAGPEQVLIEHEALRTMAMLQPNSKAAADACLRGIDPLSHPTADLHRLAALACCRAPRERLQTQATARGLVALLRKVETLELKTDSRWSTRLEQLFLELTARDQELPAALLADAQPVTAEHIFWLTWCPDEIKIAAGQRATVALLEQPTSDWSPTVLRFAASKSLDPALRERLRAAVFPDQDALVVELLSRSPTAADYRWFLDRLQPTTRNSWSFAWQGLTGLTVQDPLQELQVLAGLGGLLERSSQSDIPLQTYFQRLEQAARLAGWADLPRSSSWSQWQPFLKRHLAVDVLDPLPAMNSGETPWTEQISSASSLAGDPRRGLEVFRKAKCGQCHGGSNALGPDLTGVSRRFSYQDLFRAIFEPSRDISDRYRAVKVLTDEGTVLVGMKIYESVDGLTLQLADGQLVRVQEEAISNKALSELSLMPSGLLEGSTPSDLADLYAYLRSL